MTIDYNESPSNGDYNAKLSRDYEVIREQVRKGVLPLKERITAIETATNDYIAAQDADYERKRAKGGHIPIQLRNDVLLHRLADLVLYEDLTWSHPDKMSIVEYPVMSDWQALERSGKHFQTHNGEVSYRRRQSNGRRKTSYVGDNGEVGVSNSKMPDIYDEEIEQVTDRIDVHALIEGANLTDIQREAIELVYFGDMSQKKAGEIMGVNKSNVNEYIRHGIAKLRRNIRREMGE